MAASSSSSRRQAEESKTLTPRQFYVSLGTLILIILGQLTFTMQQLDSRVSQKLFDTVIAAIGDKYDSDRATLERRMDRLEKKMDRVLELQLKQATKGTATDRSLAV